MTLSETAASISPRSAVARDKLMHTAERLYAEHGFANVSIRKIGEAAGQRNKSVVQYHFSTRDELIHAILARHMAAIEKHRVAMVAALGESGEMSLRDWATCLVLPSIEHHIDVGTPSWYARFLAQAVVEPSLREYTIQAHLNMPSFRRLEELGQPHGRTAEPELSAQRGAMIRQLIVHMSAELEADLADRRADAATAERSWRWLGTNLITAITGLTSALRE
ncbi:helix-turn-helix domain-containing protein [Nonomuraea sp. NPDC049158]|uniref:TetR/AcrR family transcriptional regulator n=1 Tax=Nonomuraea sp. NPDC049158 TaxID=3155649 RepID=UPI0033DAA956